MCCIELWHHVLFYITYTSTRSLTPHTATVYTLVAYNTAPPIHPPLDSLAERAGGTHQLRSPAIASFTKPVVDGLGKCAPKYTMSCKKPHKGIYVYSLKLKLVVMLSKHL